MSLLIKFLLIQQFQITLSVSFFISVVHLLSRPVQSFSTNFFHFLDPQVIPATTEVYEFIFGNIKCKNYYVVMQKKLPKECAGITTG